MTLSLFIWSHYRLCALPLVFPGAQHFCTEVGVRWGRVILRSTEGSSSRSGWGSWGFQKGEHLVAPCLSLCSAYASLKWSRSMSPLYSLGISSGPGNWAGCGGGRGRKINTRTEGWEATVLSTRWAFSEKILLSQCRHQAPSCTENPFWGLPIRNQLCFSLTSTSPTAFPLWTHGLSLSWFCFQHLSLPQVQAHSQACGLICLCPSFWFLTPPTPNREDRDFDHGGPPAPWTVSGPSSALGKR